MRERAFEERRVQEGVDAQVEREELERREQQLEDLRARLNRREQDLNEFVAQLQSGLERPGF